LAKDFEYSCAYYATCLNQTITVNLLKSLEFTLIANSNILNTFLPQKSASLRTKSYANREIQNSLIHPLDIV